MRIIPAIDIIDGKCVRLTKGDYSTKKVYNEDPLEVARSFADNGIRYLHVVDLDGARSQRIINYKVLERIASGTDLIIDFGGGLKSDEDVRIAFESGATQITGGSIAAKDPALFENWLNKYGREKVILGADFKDRKIATNGWLETSDRNVIDFIDVYHQKGIAYVICTDISKDGMLQGPSFTVYREILEKIPVKLIASGGVSNTDDLSRLKEIGCEGVILGKALYEGRISLKQLAEFLES